jgi:hypothetical protein
MSEKKSMMEQVHELMDKLSEDRESMNVVMLAVEFTKEGFPMSKTCKIVGSPAVTIAGLKIIEDMIKENYEEIKRKFEEASEVNSELEEFLQKLGMSGISDPKFQELLESNPEISNKVRELVKRMKKNFGN